MGIVESSSLDQQFFGFRIYKLFDEGPLKQTGVCELEDFIIPPEDIVTNSVPFTDFIKQNLNSSVTFRVFNLRRRNFKEISVVPRTDWGDGKHGALGASVRYENYVSAHKNILRVLKTNENSLARNMNLVAGEDFIIALRPQDEDILSLNSNLQKDPLTNFKTILKENMNKNVEFYIYNEKKGSRIEKVLLQNNDKNEILGCDVGYGKLHEFPKTIDILSAEAFCREENKNETALISENETKLLTIQGLKEDVLLDQTDILISNLNNNEHSQNMAELEEKFQKDEKNKDIF